MAPIHTGTALISVSRPLGINIPISQLGGLQGVAPCYPGGFPALTLKDEKGGIVSVLTDETINMRDLKVGPPEQAPTTKHQSEFIIGLFAPTTKPGTYDLFISVGTRDGTPTIALPLKDNDGKRRYRIGQITLKEENN